MGFGARVMGGVVVARVNGGICERRLNDSMRLQKAKAFNPIEDDQKILQRTNAIRCGCWEIGVKSLRTLRSQLWCKECDSRLDSVCKSSTKVHRTKANYNRFQPGYIDCLFLLCTPPQKPTRRLGSSGCSGCSNQMRANNAASISRSVTTAAPLNHAATLIDSARSASHLNRFCVRNANITRRSRRRGHARARTRSH